MRLLLEPALAGVIVTALFIAMGTASASEATGGTASASAPRWASSGFIAYKCADDLCLIRPNGSGKRSLLRIAGPGPQWDPALSADGRKVALRGYYGVGDGAYALYVVNADGCTPKRITRSIASDPSWSPNGKWIAFDTSGEGGIWKLRPDGSGATRLVRRRGAEENSSPAWSPDGTRIAFVHFHLGRAQIWVMRADGSNATLLHADARASDELPAWSHDGMSIAFVAIAGQRSSIKVMRAGRSKVRTLIAERGAAWNPAWLPHDSGIAFLARSNGTGSLFVMRPNGTDVRRVALPQTEQFTWVAAPLPRRLC